MYSNATGNRIFLSCHCPLPLSFCIATVAALFRLLSKYLLGICSCTHRPADELHKWISERLIIIFLGSLPSSYVSWADYLACGGTPLPCPNKCASIANNEKRFL